MQIHIRTSIKSCCLSILCLKSTDMFTLITAVGESGNDIDTSLSKLFTEIFT